MSTVPSSMAGMKIAFGQRDGGESAMNVAKGLGVGFGAQPQSTYLVHSLSTTSEAWVAVYNPTNPAPKKRAILLG